MATLTIRMHESKAERLKALAAQRKISVNKLIEELATYAIAEFDTETRFRLRASQGSAGHGRQLLNELDAHFKGAPETAYGFHDGAKQTYKAKPPETNGKNRKA